MRRTVLVAMVVGLLTAVAMPATARPGTQPYSMTETMVQQIDPGTTWDTGHAVQHVRGWRATYETSEETNDLLAGELDVTVNWNLNAATWRGNLWGPAHYTSRYYPDSGWDARFTGHWTGQGTWAGHGTGTGYGAFEGMMIRFEIENVPSDTGPPAAKVSGIVFSPGQP